jgi:hypothetical protein
MDRHVCRALASRRAKNIQTPIQVVELYLSARKAIHALEPKAHNGVIA